MGRIGREHGACRPDGGLVAHGWQHASWRLACERGAVTFEAFLTPAVPPVLQELQWREEWPADARAQALAARVAAAIARWDDADAASLFAPSVNRARTRKELAHLAINHGACAVEPGARRVDHGVLRDHDPRAVFPLRCAEGELELELGTDADGRVSQIDIHPPRAHDATCWN